MTVGTSRYRLFIKYKIFGTFRQYLVLKLLLKIFHKNLSGIR